MIKIFLINFRFFENPQKTIFEEKRNKNEIKTKETKNKNRNTKNIIDENKIKAKTYTNGIAAKDDDSENCRSHVPRPMLYLYNIDRKSSKSFFQSVLNKKKKYDDNSGRNITFKFIVNTIFFFYS